MSVFNIKSKVIANRDASPTVLTNPDLAKGVAKSVIGVESTTNNASDIGAAGTAIRLVSIPSNARLDKLEYAHADIHTTSLDIAVWYPTVIPQGGQNAPASTNNAVLISSSAFKTAIAALDGGSGWTDAMGAGTSPTIIKRAQQVWQMLGLATDPELDLDFGISVRTAVNTNGYVGLRATYVD